jgi:hypothetical protein
MNRISKNTKIFDGSIKKSDLLYEIKYWGIDCMKLKDMELMLVSDGKDVDVSYNIDIQGSLKKDKVIGFDVNVESVCINEEEVALTDRENKILIEVIEKMIENED